MIAAMTHFIEPELTELAEATSPDFAYRLAEVTAEYRKLSAAMSALSSKLATLRAVFEDGTAPQLLGAAQPSVGPGSLALLDNELATVRVSLLGPFQLQIGQRDYQPDLPGQVQTILRYLISHRKCPVSRDALADVLWPEGDPTVTTSRLRVLMHTLRKSVDCRELGFGELVVISGNNYMLNPEARVWVDVEEFERHWHTGWRLSQAGRQDEAMHEYEQAAALYTGDYLEDDPYADWTLLRREALRDAYASVLSMLASMSLERHDYTGCIIWAQKLLAQDNCREDAYHMLMISHNALGQVSRAAFWYNLCVLTLQREVGVEPSEQLHALYNKIINT